MLSDVCLCHGLIYKEFMKNGAWVLEQLDLSNVRIVKNQQEPDC